MPVENEFVRTEARLESDRRLIAGLAAIVDHAADHTGLSEARRRALVVATEQTCRVLWPSLNGREPTVEVTCDQYLDRVEVAILGPAASDAGAETRLKELQKQVDKLTTESRQGSIRITLVEFLSSRQ